MNKLLPFLAFSILLLAPVGAQNAFALTTVTFDDDGTFTTPTILESGLLVTGSDDLNIVNTIGLGVVGGNDDETVDNDEFVTFGFSGTATNINYIVTTAVNGDFDNLLGESQIEAFDSNGVSLGTQNVDGVGTKSVSVLFGNVPISHFRVSMIDNDAIVISDISYDLSPAVTCGPGTVEVNGVCECEQQNNQCVGGVLIDTNTVSLLAGAIGTNPVITGLVGITLAGVAAQAVWFVHKKKKNTS